MIKWTGYDHFNTDKAAIASAFGNGYLMGLLNDGFNTFAQSNTPEAIGGDTESGDFRRMYNVTQLTGTLTNLQAAAAAPTVASSFRYFHIKKTQKITIKSTCNSDMRVRMYVCTARKDMPTVAGLTDRNDYINKQCFFNTTNYEDTAITPVGTTVINYVGGCVPNIAGGDNYYRYQDVNAPGQQGPKDFLTFRKTFKMRKKPFLNIMLKPGQHKSVTLKYRMPGKNGLFLFSRLLNPWYSTATTGVTTGLAAVRKLSKYILIEAWGELCHEAAAASHFNITPIAADIQVCNTLTWRAENGIVDNKAVYKNPNYVLGAGGPQVEPDTEALTGIGGGAASLAAGKLPQSTPFV